MNDVVEQAGLFDDDEGPSEGEQVENAQETKHNHSDDEDSEGDATGGPIDLGMDLSVENIVEKIHIGLSAKNRQRMSRDAIEKVVRSLDLTDKVKSRPAVRLKVRRLKFSGEKKLTEEANPEPFTYNQLFQDGVNVLLIKDNSVGKSSVMKTIKYALTGDDEDYDNGPRSWIRRIWLQISLDETPFTIHIDRREAGDVGYIIFGEEEQSFEDVELLPAVIYRVTGATQITESLRSFFLQRLGISQLGWRTGNADAVQTSWRTYFQALEIPDSSEHYLLVDDSHAYGNQGGLILQMFLGLSLVEPINQLLVDKAKIKKIDTPTNTNLQNAKVEAQAAREEVATIEQQVAELDAAIHTRAEAFRTTEPMIRLSQLQFRGAEQTGAQQHLISQRDALTQQIYRAEASARNIREHIALQLHFTGLDVSLCPNCDAHVEPEAIIREKQSQNHNCRLCGKEAQAASTDDIETYEAQVAELEAEIAMNKRRREQLNRDIARIVAGINALNDEARMLNDIVREGANFILPTDEERNRRSQLERRAGELLGRATMLDLRVAEDQAANDEAVLMGDIRDTVRKFLAEQASRLSSSTLAQLGSLTAEMVRFIGAEHVSNVTCSLLGSLTLWKDGTRVKSFKGIHNSGDRLRIKIAFFLALMRLGAEHPGARHPGFLLIDQPGSSEMVDEDFAALAAVLHEVDRQYADKLQIICFTARSQFDNATIQDKIFGPQNGKYVF